VLAVFNLKLNQSFSELTSSLMERDLSIESIWVADNDENTAFQIWFGNALGKSKLSGSGFTAS